MAYPLYTRGNFLDFHFVYNMFFDMSARTYVKSLQYLDSFTNYEKASGYRYTEKTFSLLRMKKLAAAFNNPQAHFSSVHVAGTTGKGSTCILAASLLAASGYRVGLYTSPHLHDFCERICIVRKNRKRVVFEKVPREFIRAKTARIERYLRREKLHEPPTTFELYTLLAFLYFSRAKVDIAVVEVGMGGRLDATNIIKPLCSVITRIAYDHRAQLGNTLAKIAHEKAGIIKQNVPVVCAPQTLSARRVIEKICKEKSVAFIPVKVSSRSLYEPFIQKYGEHQRVNVETALSVLGMLEKKKFRIAWDAVSRLHELHPVLLPARIQKVRDTPPLYVDGGHNLESAKALSKFLSGKFGGKKGTLIFQIFKDKEIQRVLKILLPHFRAAYIPKLAYPRAMEAGKLEQMIRVQGIGYRVQGFKSVDEAMKAALRQRGNAFVVVTGSFYLAADALEKLGTGSLP